MTRLKMVLIFALCAAAVLGAEATSNKEKARREARKKEVEKHKAMEDRLAIAEALGAQWRKPSTALGPSRTAPHRDHARGCLIKDTASAPLLRDPSSAVPGAPS